jgi:hypothetical protein
MTIRPGRVTPRGSVAWTLLTANVSVVALEEPGILVIFWKANFDKLCLVAVKMNWV